MRIIAVSIAKGGPGKTSVAVNLATGLALKKKRVLLIDMDPQGNASSSLGIMPGQIEHCMADVIQWGPLEELSKQLGKKSRMVLWSPR